MESFNNVAPWIAAIVLFAIVIFFCVFYIMRLINVNKEFSSLKANNILSSDNEEAIKLRRKLKDEIVHDIVADITPVLEKRLEKAF